MYYTEIDPDTMQKVYVPKTAEEKRLQRALLQYRKKENYHLIKEALIKAGRQDLIGFKPGCLIKPMRGENFAQTSTAKKYVGQSKYKQQKGKPIKGMVIAHKTDALFGRKTKSSRYQRFVRKVVATKEQ